MNILVLDTSTGRAAIGLRVRDGSVYSTVTDGAQRHGRDLIPCLAELLARAGVAAREIEAIGVGLGPGSYTGLRVGVTAAKTLAYVTGAALVGLDSLEAVAWNARGNCTADLGCRGRPARRRLYGGFQPERRQESRSRVPADARSSRSPTGWADSSRARSFWGRGWIHRGSAGSSRPICWRATRR